MKFMLREVLVVIVMLSVLKTPQTSTEMKIQAYAINNSSVTWEQIKLKHYGLPITSLKKVV